MADTTMLSLTLPKQAMAPAHAARRIGDPTLSTIIDVVAEDYAMTADIMMTASKQKRYAHPRFVVSWLARQLTTQSFPMIARRLGLCDHTSVIYGVRKVQRWVETRPDIKERLDHLAEECRRRTP